MTGEAGIRIAERAELDLLEPAAAEAVVRAVETAVSAGAIFSGGSTPEGVLRQAVASAIDAIEARGDLLRRFLALGPYEGDGPIPPELLGKRLSDHECAKAITLIHSHAVNCFKGQIAEIFAIESFSRLAAQLRHEGRVPRSSIAYVGDAAMPLRRGTGVAKGADLHLLDESKAEAVLVAVGEVKSYSAFPQHRHVPDDSE